MEIYNWIKVFIIVCILIIIIFALCFAVINTIREFIDFKNDFFSKKKK